MIQTVIASFPIPAGSEKVPLFLRNIIDKKISEIALNTLERFAHWLCFRIFAPYRILYEDKLSRIHTFKDGLVKLYDATKDKTAEIKCISEIEWISINKIIIPLNKLNNAKSDLFTENLSTTDFSRANSIDYVVVKDRNKPRLYQVDLQETARVGNQNPPPISWDVDATKPFLNKKIREVAFGTPKKIL